MVEGVGQPVVDEAGVEDSGDLKLPLRWHCMTSQKNVQVRYIKCEVKLLKERRFVSPFPPCIQQVLSLKNLLFIRRIH